MPVNLATKRFLQKNICKEKQDASEGFDEVTVLECQTDRCNKKTVTSVPRVKVPIRVQDCTGIVTLTLFEREVLKLLNVSANQLLDNNIEFASEGNFPKEFNALKNRKFAFKIAIGPYNLKNKADGFSVSKLTENPIVMSELDAMQDSVSRTGDDETPISNLNKSMFTTPSGPVKSSSVTMMEKELKRNLDVVYDVDFCSSQSSTKLRKSDNDMEEDANVTVGLLKPKIEK
ncbi:putative nucleic acid-binding, replication factor A [Helianthus anomalus]